MEGLGEGRVRLGGGLPWWPGCAAHIWKSRMAGLLRWHVRNAASSDTRRDDSGNARWGFAMFAAAAAGSGGLGVAVWGRGRSSSGSC